MKVLSMYCLEQGLNPDYRYLKSGNVLRCSSRSLAIAMCAGLALDLEHDVNLSCAAAEEEEEGMVEMERRNRRPKAQY